MGPTKKPQTKRIQVDKTKARLFIVMAIASVVTVFSLVAAKSFYSEASYLNRVASEKEDAVKQANKNTEAIKKLVAAYKDFAEKDPNAIGGIATGTGPRDGENARLVLDALPSKYDFPALTASLESLLAGYTVDGITGTDDAILQSVPTENGLVDIPFTVAVSGDYKSMQALFDSIERSIRPFQILSLDLTGTGASMQASLNMKTFYQPEKSLDIETKVVK